MIDNAQKKEFPENKKDAYALVELNKKVHEVRDHIIYDLMISQLSQKFRFTSTKFQKNHEHDIHLLSHLKDPDALARLILDYKKEERDKIVLNPSAFEKKLLLKCVVDYSFVEHPSTVLKIKDLFIWYNNLITTFSTRENQEAIIQYSIVDAPTFSKKLKVVLHSSGIRYTLKRVNKERCIQGIAFRCKHLLEIVKMLEIQTAN